MVFCVVQEGKGRGVENVCVSSLSKVTWQHRERTVGRSASGGGVGTAEFIDLCFKQLKLLWGEDGIKI